MKRTHWRHAGVHWWADHNEIHAFVRHLVRVHDWTAEDVLGVLEKPWNYHSEFTDYLTTQDTTEGYDLVQVGPVGPNDFVRSVAALLPRRTMTPFGKAFIFTERLDPVEVKRLQESGITYRYIPMHDRFAVYP